MSYPASGAKLRRAQQLLKTLGHLINHPAGSPIDLDVLIPALEALEGFARGSLSSGTGRSAEGEALLPHSEVAELKRAGLSGRTYNLLRRQDIDMVGQLMGCSAATLLEIPNFGPDALKEVQAALGYWNLALSE